MHPASAKEALSHANRVFPDHQPNFDRVAAVYRWIERAVFGRTLDHARLRYLDRLRTSQRVLVMGDGDGRFLEQLLRENPTIQAEYLDLSAAMLQRARQRCGAQRVTYRQADALGAELPEAGYDAAATHFFLDCFDEAGIARIAGKLRAALRPGACWVISEFRVPEGLPAWPARALIRIMYGFFRVTAELKVQRLADHRPVLQRLGFQLKEVTPHLGGMVVSERWRALKQSPETHHIAPPERVR